MILRMPTINRKLIKEKNIPYIKERDLKSSEFYGSKAWRRFRNTFLSLHPICECCLEHGYVTPSTDVHHKIPWMRGKNEEEQWNLFLDEKNCMSLCERCHIGLHNKDREYNMGCLDSLTETEYNYIHGKNY